MRSSKRVLTCFPAFSAPPLHIAYVLQYWTIFQTTYTFTYIFACMPYLHCNKCACKVTAPLRMFFVLSNTGYSPLSLFVWFLPFILQYWPIFWFPCAMHLIFCQAPIFLYFNLSVPFFFIFDQWECVLLSVARKTCNTGQSRRHASHTQTNPFL